MKFNDPPHRYGEVRNKLSGVGGGQALVIDAADSHEPDFDVEGLDMMMGESVKISSKKDLYRDWLGDITDAEWDAARKNPDGGCFQVIFDGACRRWLAVCSCYKSDYLRKKIESQ